MLLLRGVITTNRVYYGESILCATNAEMDLALPCCVYGSVDYAIKFMKMSAAYVRERLSQQQCLYIFFVGYRLSRKMSSVFSTSYCCAKVLLSVLLQFMRRIDNNHIFGDCFYQKTLRGLEVVGAVMGACR